MDPIMEIAAKNELFVVEDCAQALLSHYKGRLCGTIGHIGCFSFQQSKHLTTGDGGMVITNEDSRYGRQLALCHDKGWPRDGISKPVEEGEVVVFGSRDHLFLAPNYHMTELQAAVGIEQLKKLPAMVAQRRTSAAQLSDLLEREGAAELGLQRVEDLPGCEGSAFWWCFTFDPDLLRAGVTPEMVYQALGAEGVKCEHGYPSARRMLYDYDVLRNRKTFGSNGFPLCSPPARKEWEYGPGLCPVAEEVCPRTFCLHWSEKTELEHVELIGAAILKVLRAYVK